jgi:3-oxoacyl-[acyl-carrier-protein] synthase II
VEKKHVILRTVGLTTPLGTSAESTWNAILAGATTADLGRVPLGASERLTRVEQLALAAINDARVAGAIDAMVVATSKGNVEEWMAGRDDTIRQRDVGRRGSQAAHSDASWGLADLGATIARELNLGRIPRPTFSAACASGLHALFRAKLLIDSGEASRVLVVAAESSLHGMFTHTFRRLGALAKPDRAARPFDRTRDGFVMSESAACVLIEHATALPGDVVLGRCAIAGDAAHLTNVDPTGTTIRWLLNQVVGGSPVDFVHAHATGTGADEVELRAIESTVAGKPVVWSHKAALGHSLGAAGLGSVALSVLSHRRGMVPGNVNTREPIAFDPARVDVSAQPVRRTIRRSVCLASGFGGACAAIELETV